MLLLGRSAVVIWLQSEREEAWSAMSRTSLPPPKCSSHSHPCRFTSNSVKPVQASHFVQAASWKQALRSITNEPLRWPVLAAERSRNRPQQEVATLSGASPQPA